MIIGFCVIFYPGADQRSEDRLLIGNYVDACGTVVICSACGSAITYRRATANYLSGILWIILLPLATAAVLALAFTEFLRIQIDVPYISFFLSGLVPWALFSQGTLTGMRFDHRCCWTDQPD